MLISKSNIENNLNILELLIIILVIAMAYYFQFIGHELPCPLCLLQRIGFLCIAFGLILNISFGVKPIHYGLCILSALFTMFVAGRQMLLHIAPGSGSYGSPLFGLHIYTWSFLTAAAIIALNVLILILHDSLTQVKISHAPTVQTVSHILFVILVFLTGFNVITTFSECGISQCPDNPTHYLHG